MSEFVDNADNSDNVLRAVLNFLSLLGMSLIVFGRPLKIFMPE
jgi:hypothetical protein